MAKYAISRNGIDALEEMKNSLVGAIEEIVMVSDALFDYVTGLENGLGVYYKEIIMLTRRVLTVLKDAKEGDDGIDVLVNGFIPNQIRNIEDLINMGFGDDDDAPTKSKKLTR